MQKITKKEYNNQKAELLSKIAKTEKQIKALTDWFNMTIDFNTITDKQREKVQKVGCYCNSLYDQQYSLDKQLQSLENEWDRRNWTYSDYVQYNLIANNID